MSEVSSTIREDLGVVTERLIPFAPRSETREKLWELHEEYKVKVANMEDLRYRDRLSCPYHEDNEEVIITGGGKNDGKKLKCKKWHDPNLTGRDTTKFRFSTYTSHEAYKVYQDFLVEALTLMTTCEGTLEGVAKYLNISKHMVELGEHTLFDYLGDSGKDMIEVGL